MAVQFFFKEPEKDNMGEVLSSGYKAGLEMRAGQIKKDLDSTYNKHVVTEPQYDAAGNVIARPGDLDAPGFIKSAQEAGMPMKESMEYLAHQKALRDAQLDQAQTDANIRDLGYDPSPSVTGRAGAPIGDPASQANPQAQQLPAGFDVIKSWFEDKKANPNVNPAHVKTPVSNATTQLPGIDLLTPAQSRVTGIPNETIEAANGIIGGLQSSVASGANPTGAPIKTELRGGEATNPLTGEVVGRYGDGATMPAQTETTPTNNGLDEKNPMDLGEGTITAQLAKRVGFTRQDTRTVGQAVQDTYSPQATTMGVGVEDAEAEGLFDWAPVDDNSNEFRKYKSTLDSHLKSAGMVDAKGNPDASMLLKQLYVNTYNQNLAAKPDTRLRALGPEGRKKYIEMEAEYKASQIKAAGLAGKAVLDQRQALSEEANKYGVQTNDSIEEKRKEEKHEADLGGRRPDDYKTRYVTEAEAAKGRDITSAYFDIRDGVREGGFAGAYKAAVAKAKSDGSVNKDAIIANLIAMGAAASSDAIKLNFYMNSDGNLTSAGLKWLTSGGKGKGPSQAWGKSALANIAETARLYGFDPEKKPTPPSGKKGAGVRRGSKNWTSKPDGTQQAGDTYKGHTLGADGKWR